MQELSSFVVKWDGPVRVVPDGQQVDILTSTGWKLLAMYQEEFVESAFDEVVNPHPRKENDYNWTPKISVETSHQCRQTRFVLGLGAHEHAERQAGEIEDARRQRDEAMEESREHSKRVEHLEKEVERLENCRKNVSKTYEETLERVRSQQTQIRNMERDLAKARKAMGELQWREIMGDGNG